MATASIKTFVEVTGVGETVVVGSDVTSQDVTLTGEMYQARAVVADDYGTVTLWQTGDGGVDTFDLLILETDADVFVELRNDQSTDEFLLLFVPANHPLVLVSDDVGAVQTTGRIDGADLVDGTDYGQVDQIVVQRDVADDVGDANVRLLLFD